MPRDTVVVNSPGSDRYPRPSRKRQPTRRKADNRGIPKIANGVLSQCLLLAILASIAIPTRPFRSQPIIFPSGRLNPSLNPRHNYQEHFPDNTFQPSSNRRRWPKDRCTTDSPCLVTRFGESQTQSSLEKGNDTTSKPKADANLDETEASTASNNATTTASNETLQGSSVPFFANAESNSTTESLEKILEPHQKDIAHSEIESAWCGGVTRRDAFRYGTILTSAVWVTGLTFSQTDSSSKTSRESPAPSPVIPSPSATVSEDSGRLVPVNLTKVASQTNINVTMNCEKMCVSIDSSNFTFNKVEKAKVPDWLPAFLAPKSQVVKKIPNSELLVAATAAGSVTEMARTSLLYPLQTVKTRLQADRNAKLTNPEGPQQLLSLSEQLKTLSSNIQQKIDDGDLYAGISPTLLVSVPATGIYYGVRDVTKRLLFMTPLDSTWIAVGGALVGDVVSLCFRTPSDALATRLQAQNESTGDWLGDSFKRLPMVILTDLPYLISKIILNKSLIQGSLSVSEYAGYAVFAAVVAGFLTTPFDVARTRILLDKQLVVSEDEEEGLSPPGNLQQGVSIPDDPTEGDESESNTPAIATSRPGYSVLRTMIQITEEGDGGIKNLFSGWLERVVYLGIGRAWLEPIQLIGYIGIRDAVLLEWFR